MAKTKFCKGLSDISDTYSAVLFDQLGVLHNGKEPFDGVIECLKELKSRKKIVILVSNTEVREKENKQLLKDMGIGPSLYTKIITTGEVIATGLKDRVDEPFKSIGKSYFSFHTGDDYRFLQDTEVERVTDVEDADFVLVSGWDKLKKPVKELEKELRLITKKGLMTIFAMPSSRALLSPNYIMGPGSLVRRLKDFGGVVHSVGKPYTPIFQECVKFLKEKDIFPGQAVMVGDLMAYDMIGAQNANIDSCFVRGGMHAGHFRNASNLAELDMALNILISQYNMRPNYMIHNVQWGEALPDRKHRRRLQPGEGIVRRGRKRRLERRKTKGSEETSSD